MFLGFFVLFIIGFLGFLVWFDVMWFLLLFVDVIGKLNFWLEFLLLEVGDFGFGFGVSDGFGVVGDIGDLVVDLLLLCIVFFFLGICFS